MKRKTTLFLLACMACYLCFSQNCVDIDTKQVVSYLNKEIKPTLDLKLDRDDGFLAIKRQRQDLHLKDVSYKMSRFSRTWKYSFNNVRRVDSNFFYDSKLNLFALDVKFESDDSEIKGLCPGCVKAFRDSRAPDINWTSVQILRMYLKPKVYDNSISFFITDIKFIGDFQANGLGSIMGSLISKSLNELKTELKKVFENGQTQRLFNNALNPLLRSKRISSVRSVSLGSKSLRTCR